MRRRLRRVQDRGRHDRRCPPQEPHGRQEGGRRIIKRFRKLLFIEQNDDLRKKRITTKRFCKITPLHIRVVRQLPQLQAIGGLMNNNNCCCDVISTATTTTTATTRSNNYYS